VRGLVAACVTALLGHGRDLQKERFNTHHNWWSGAVPLGL
jgi:hypothetical protein